MQWLNILAVLACPLMMLFCMKGMFSGRKHAEGKNDAKGTGVSAQELQSLQIKMADLIEQNHQLTKEIQAVKKGTTETTDRVV